MTDIRTEGKSLETLNRHGDNGLTGRIISRGKTGKYLDPMYYPIQETSEEEVQGEEHQASLYYNHSEEDEEDDEDGEEETEEEEEEEEGNEGWKEKVDAMEQMDEETKAEYLKEILAEYPTETKAELLLKALDFLGPELYRTAECETARDLLLVRSALMHSCISQLLCDPRQYLPRRVHPKISYHSNVSQMPMGRTNPNAIRNATHRAKLEHIRNYSSNVEASETMHEDGESENSFEEVLDLAKQKEAEDDEEESEELQEEDEEEENSAEEEKQEEEEESKREEEEEDDEEDEGDFEYADLMNTENSISGQTSPFEFQNVVANKEFFGSSDLPSTENVEFQSISEEEMFAGIDKLEDIMDNSSSSQQNEMNRSRKMMETNENKKRRIF